MEAFYFRSLVVLVVALLPISAQSRPATEYLHPQTGQKCVTPTTGPETNDKIGHNYFQNICERGFTVRVTFKNGKSRETWVGGATRNGPGKSSVRCERVYGECSGGEWEVR